MRITGQNIIKLFSVAVIAASLSSCALALIGAGGAAGGYYLANDKGTPGEYTRDSVITSKIKTKFISTKGINSMDISVVSTKGIVYLTGSVPTTQQKNLAIVVAKDTNGVKDVVADNLHVSP